jgi:HTH-type transcriptional regulator, sugar sensing transcriptional regulator
MNEDLIKHVEELGLSNKEARVYIANLMLGPAGVQQIADTSGIKRVTTYVILESLAGLGLVSQSIHAKKTLFNAEAPDNLRRLLDKREQSLRDQKQQLDELLPQLRSLKVLSIDAPSVKFYDGFEGIQANNKNFFAAARKNNIKSIYGISNLDLLYKYFPDIEDQGANPDRVSAGIKSKFLYTSSKGPIMKATDKAKNRESRYVPLEKYSLDCDISIAGNTTALLSLGASKAIGIMIESEQVARGLQSLFDLAWEAAAPYNTD